MGIMNRTALLLPFVIGLGLIVAAGCTRTPTKGPNNLKTKNGAAREDILKPALDLIRQATGVEHYKDALHLVNTHLSRDGAKKVAQYPPDRKQALQKLCRLTDEEMEEVDAIIFRPLDSHYLEGCFLFRDAARWLEIANLPPIDQTRLCFRWVMRRCLLHEQDDEWLPTARILRRGFGGGRDRALVFLTLLRQFQIEGCLIAPPGPPSDPTTPLLVGVVLNHNGKTEIFLFDPRVGQPIFNSDGKTVATLDQVRARPELLKPAAISADLIPKLEVYQFTPLGAISARMQYLQEVLAFQDRVVLFQDALKVSAALSAAAGREALVWNFPASAKDPTTPSPTRALRLFLPVEEGGIDKTGRLKRFEFQQIPWPHIVQKFQEMGVYQDIFEQAQENLRRHTTVLFNTFYLQPEEYFLRGQFDATLKRIDRIRTVLETEEAAKPLEESDFANRLEEWRLRVQDAYKAWLVRKEPDGPAKVNALWNEDQYLLNLLQLDSEIPLRKFEKRMLSLILLHACREPLGKQVSYLVAACWHEKAAQLQAHHDFVESSGKEASIVKQRAKDAWANARAAWSKYLDRYGFVNTGLSQRLDDIQRRWNGGSLELALNLWEQIHQDINATVEARLRLAEAQKFLVDLKASAPPLKALLSELDLLQNSELSKHLSAAMEKARGNAMLAQRVELLTRNWVAQGNIYWLRESVQRRLEQAK